MLPYYCPLCEHSARVLESKVASNGTRRRRIACQSAACGHRWSDWDGPRPPHVSGGQRRTQGAGRKGGAPQFMTDERVRFLLEHRELNNAAAARALGGGCSGEAVRLVRAGLICLSLAPEIPRWRQPGGRTCHDCNLWRGRCALGLPDPEEEGIGFAAECASFRLSEASAGR